MRHPLRKVADVQLFVPQEVGGALPAPIPYQGSKRKLASQILRLVPGDVENLYEPFCGSAAVSVAAGLRHPDSTKIHLNDANEPLMNLWKMILDEPENVADAYEALWTRQLTDPDFWFVETRKEFNETHDPVRLLYLLARCVKAAVRYNSRGEFNQSADKRRLGSKPERMRDQIRRVSGILSGRTTVSSGDFMAAIESARVADVIYLDPPYQGTSSNRDRRYLFSMERSHFVVCVEDLIKRDLSVIISYDGRSGTKTYGDELPASLGLLRLEVNVGRSTQATFLGREDDTVESIYVSPALVRRLDGVALAG